MTSTPTDTPLEDLLEPDRPAPDAYASDDDEFDDAPSARRIPRLTAALIAAVALGLAFTGGVLVQKHATSSSSTAASGFPGGAGGLPSGFPSGLGGLGGLGGGTSSGGSGGSTSTSDVPVVVGTVVSVSGTQVTVKDLGGKTHVIRTTTTTTVTSQKKVPLSTLTAGQSVRVSGTKTADGSVDATAVTAR